MKAAALRILEAVAIAVLTKILSDAVDRKRDDK